jgi:hypothetical protein
MTPPQIATGNYDYSFNATGADQFRTFFCEMAVTTVQVAAWLVDGYCTVTSNFGFLLFDGATYTLLPRTSVSIYDGIN